MTCSHVRWISLSHCDKYVLKPNLIPTIFKRLTKQTYYNMDTQLEKKYLENKAHQNQSMEPEKKIARHEAQKQSYNNMDPQLKKNILKI